MEGSDCRWTDSEGTIAGGGERSQVEGSDSGRRWRVEIASGGERA